MCHADHKLLQLRCSSCAKPCFRAGGFHTNTTSQTSAAAGTPARTYCPQHLINHCFISKGFLRSVVVQLHFGCISASSESESETEGSHPALSYLASRLRAVSIPSRLRASAAQGASALTHCPPEGGRGSARRFARLERGRQPAPLPNTSRYPGGRRRPGRGPGGAQPAPLPAGVTTRQLSPSIPAGLLCLLGAGAWPVLSRGGGSAALR